MKYKLLTLKERLYYLKKSGFKWWRCTKYFKYPTIPSNKDIYIHQIWKKLKEKDRRKKAIATKE